MTRSIDPPRSPARSPRQRLAAVQLIGVVFAAVLLAGCVQSSPAAPSTSPSGGPPIASQSPQPTTIATPEAAAAVVLASDPRFIGIPKLDPNMIGQCCTYQAVPTTAGYTVTIEIGWGDCPAGCINRHHWTYSVARNGAVHLVNEDGPPIPAGVPGPSGGTAGGATGIRGIAAAGPTCPVVRPNDPNCADRPVPGATVHVMDATGTEIATVTTDATGSFTLTLAPGAYHLVADPVLGLMRTAAPVDVTVGVGLAPVQLTYDTGIR